MILSIDGHKSANTVHSALGYYDAIPEKEYILMLHKAIHVGGSQTTRSTMQ